MKQNSLKFQDKLFIEYTRIEEERHKPKMDDTAQSRPNSSKKLSKIVFSTPRSRARSLLQSPVNYADASSEIPSSKVPAAPVSSDLQSFDSHPITQVPQGQDSLLTAKNSAEVHHLYFEILSS